MEIKREKLITVFTSTYNRAEKISNLFNSLQKQSCKDFQRIIIDDGSNTDGLEKKFNQFVKDSDFEIEFIKRPNVGKYNELIYVFKKLQTKFAVCVDDDDVLVPNAIETIKNDINKIGNDIGLIYPRNICINLDLEHVDVMDLWLYYKKHVETLIVFKSCVLSDTIFPEFQNERFTSEELIYNKLAGIGKFKFRDIVLCNSGYLTEGLTNNLFAHRRNNPLSTYALFLSRYNFLSKYGFLQRKLLRIKCLTNYYSCLIKNEKMKFKIIGNAFYLFISYPLGIIVYLKKKQTKN